MDHGGAAGAGATPSEVALRQVVLACIVLHDLDVQPRDDGVLVRGGPPIAVSWPELRSAAGAADLAGPLARALVLRYLRGVRIAHDCSTDLLGQRVRPVGLPADHALHPGPGWVKLRVLGGALDVGIGFVGVGADPDRVELIPPGCLAAAGRRSASWWPAALDYLERMGGVAAELLTGGRSQILRPVGDCDVLTLLASTRLRAALCSAGQGGPLVPGGMRAVAAPMRTRGWLDLSRIDPAFVLAAAAATDEVDRGFPRPLLITRDEVMLAAAGGRPAVLALLDPAVDRTPLSGVRWR